MTVSGSIHVSTNGPVLFLFWLSTVPLYACATSFVHSSVDGHLGCSLVLDIGSGAAAEHRCVCVLGAVVLWCVPSSVEPFVDSSFSLFPQMSNSSS